MEKTIFLRWLIKNYKSTIVECVEIKPMYYHGELLYADASQPNPNRVEFDNLYLEMDSIIHQSTHPEHKLPPEYNDDVRVAILESIDRLFRAVRPRKLLYIATNGVSPRAKIDKIRSRCFRVSKETQNEDCISLKLLKNEYLPLKRSMEDRFDSNCINPGTLFMNRLKKCLRSYIHDRLNNDPGWKNINVILSDADVPGEGKYKIMDYIRRQTTHPKYDPNTQHVLYGINADVILLGLATHEPNFTIIREDCGFNGQNGHKTKECTCSSTSGAALIRPNPTNQSNNFIFVRLNIFRKLLDDELQTSNLMLPYDFKRALDDWIFLVLLINNDVLPPLPSLNIIDGGLEDLMYIYKKCVRKVKNWLTNSGYVHLDHLQVLMNELGAAENEVFSYCRQYDLGVRARDKLRKKLQRQQIQNQQEEHLGKKRSSTTADLDDENNNLDNEYDGYEVDMEDDGSEDDKDYEDDDGSEDDKDYEDDDGSEDDKDYEDDEYDQLMLWKVGYKERYYKNKFDVTRVDLEFGYQVAQEYIRGLCWLLNYCYYGCPNWKWYYPYHYAPFASDFVNISGISTEFEKGTLPLLPLQQLMSVMPAASSHHVPEAWAKLMSDPCSPIIHLYPKDFKIELKRNRYGREGVVILPLVDEDALLNALQHYYSELTEAEKQRNIRGHDVVYVSTGNKNCEFQLWLYQILIQEQQTPIEEHQRSVYMIDTDSDNVTVNADFMIIGRQLLSSMIGLPTVLDNHVVCVRFRNFQCPENFIFQPRYI